MTLSIEEQQSIGDSVNMRLVLAEAMGMTKGEAFPEILASHILSSMVDQFCGTLASIADQTGFSSPHPDGAAVMLDAVQSALLVAMVTAHAVGAGEALAAWDDTPEVSTADDFLRLLTSEDVPDVFGDDMDDN